MCDTNQNPAFCWVTFCIYQNLTLLYKMYILVYLDQGLTKWIFLSAHMITNNYLTLMADTVKITD